MRNHDSDDPFCQPPPRCSDPRPLRTAASSPPARLGRHLRPRALIIAWDISLRYAPPPHALLRCMMLGHAALCDFCSSPAYSWQKHHGCGRGLGEALVSCRAPSPSPEPQTPDRPRHGWVRRRFRERVQGIDGDIDRTDESSSKKNRACPPRGLHARLHAYKPACRLTCTLACLRALSWSLLAYSYCLHNIACLLLLAYSCLHALSCMFTYSCMLGAPPAAPCGRHQHHADASSICG